MDMLELAQRAPGARRKQLARSRQPDAAIAALHQRRAEIMFEVLDLPRHGGRRDIEIFGGGAHRVGTHQFVEIHQGA